MLNSQINRLLIAVVLVNICAIIGCHRSYYRRQADAEAMRLIREKSFDPRWNGATGKIDIDPQSRMFDPFSQDHPPIPPDDASSHQLMHCVDGKEGFPQWHANGDTSYVENPEWKSYLPINEQGQVVLNIERAFQLALINSPDFQQQREALYLSALDVSLERFGFDTQLFVGNRSNLGLQRGNTFINNTGPAVTLERLGVTGATFMASLANTILFNFGGNDTQSATSLIDFSIVQPLLRGAGRDRIMESLTQSERDLLANIRQLERFRRGFYLDIIVGRNPGISVNASLLNIPGAAAAQAGGFVGLLQSQQEIRNQELNVRQLEASLEQFREFFLRERFDAVQLKRFESSFYSQQRRLLNLKTTYETQLDRYKAALGLPPDLDIVIDDSFLDQFKLISDEVNEQLISIQDLRRNLGAALNAIDDLFEDQDKAGFEWPNNIADLVENLLPSIDNAQLALNKIVSEDRQQLESDFKKLDDSRPNRLAYLAKLNEAIQRGEILSDVDPTILEPESIPESSELRKQLESPETDNAEFIINADGEEVIPPRSITKRADTLKQEFGETKLAIEGFRQLEGTMTQEQVFEYIVRQFQEKIPGQLSELNTLMLELSLLQAIARSNSIETIDMDIRAEQAIRIARCFRRDWMNARAALVDNWRNIEFVADQLESQVDLIFEGDMGNARGGSNPFKLRYETGQLRGGLRFDLPIVRLAERNNYRAALINYQQTRRRYYQFEDGIKQSIRQTIRNVDQNKVLFELDRRTVQVSIENIEVNRLKLDEPVRPGASLQLGATTAQNLSDAIVQLNGNQNQFLQSWVNLEVLRRSLDYDMGTMQLDEMGAWDDPGEIGPSIGVRAAAIMGIDLESDCQFCENIGIAYDDIRSVDEDPAFDNTPFNADTPGNQPEQPPLEPLPGSPQQPPTPETIAPEKPKPVLNQPQTGMLSPKPDSPEKMLSQIPKLLYQPVDVGMVPQPRVAQRQAVDSSNNDPTQAKRKSDSVAESDPSAVKTTALPKASNPTNQSPNVGDPSPSQVIATPVNWEESVAIDQAANSNEFVETRTPAGDSPTGGLIERQFKVTRPIQASAVTSAPTLNFGAPRPLPNPLEPVQASAIPESLPPTDSSDVKLSSVQKHSLVAADSKTLENTAFGWQTKQSSLGGILQRFTPQSGADITSGNSQN